MLPDPQLLIKMHRTMLLIRSFETHANELFQQQRIMGPLHFYIGEEAVAVGACSAIRSDDYITSTHRGHGHCIAKGGDPKRMMAELIPRKSSREADSPWPGRYVFPFSEFLPYPAYTTTSFGNSWQSHAA